MPELAAHVRDVPVNQIREITEAAWHTPGAIVLSIGEPGFALPRHILEAGMACLDRDETNYTPNAGIPALREAFAARFREHNATPVGRGPGVRRRRRPAGPALRDDPAALPRRRDPDPQSRLPDVCDDQPACCTPSRSGTRCTRTTTSSRGSRTSRR